jgi:glycerophosphoryl diester phosphodiesterase
MDSIPEYNEVEEESMAQRLQRIAHRGGSLIAPENTMAAFRNALTMPVDYIELDVQMSRDGRLIVFHDATVDRLTEGTGNILDLDFEYLRSLNVAAKFPGGWPEVEHIPTLQEVLALVKGRLRVCIEIKLGERDGRYGRYPQIAEAVTREVRNAKMLERVLIISFDWATLSRIRYLEPSFITGALVSRELWSPHEEQAMDELCKRVSQIGCNWIDIDRELFTPDMLPIFHQNGFKVGIWTVDELEELKALASIGVDALTTDRPDLFGKL